jgi:uncharacterized protein VirK/YbjX
MRAFSELQRFVYSFHMSRSKTIVPNIFKIFLHECLTLTWGNAPITLSRIAHPVWAGLTNIATLPSILGLLKLDPFAQVNQTETRFAFKYLTPDYLITGISVEERAACFLHHYNRLHAAAPNHLLRRILLNDFTLCEITQDGYHFAITMSLSKPSHNEGEMSLRLLVNGEFVFLLSFTIVPGWVVNSNAKETLLISRLQGARGRFGLISLATKTLHDVSPASLLLAALQGVGMWFQIGDFACVSSTRHRHSVDDQFTSVLESAYDSFFTALGLRRSPAGFFVSPIPMTEKPLSLIKKGHKIRTKEKRMFKREVQLACAESLEKGCECPDAERVELPIKSRSSHAACY